MNILNNPDNTTRGETSFFSAKPMVKKMNLDMIFEPKEGFSCVPPPLSLKRNGFGSDFNYEREDSILGTKSSDCPDEDVSGKYFGASIRKGPFMNKQEDRVSPINHLFTKNDLVVYIQRKVPRK